MAKPEILALTEEELAAQITPDGHKKFRAQQVFQWLHLKQVFDVRKMTNLKADFQDYLLEKFNFPDFQILNQRQSPSDHTAKYLFAYGKRQVESVWLPYENRQSICVSVQSGCSLDCSFCATGKIAFKGNLTAGEILAQVYGMQQLYERRITNIVFMGMGEPFYNYDNVLRAADLIAHQHGLNISRRRITLSTSGVLPGIKRFVEEKQPYRLALSLHAVFPEKRAAIMDIEEKFNFLDVLEYLRAHRAELQQGQLMFEYIMIDGVNIFPDDAQELARWANLLRAKVNLIPMNTEFNGMRRPSDEKIYDFWRALVERGVVAVNRKSPAKDIDGACGMLAGRQAETTALDSP
ncbi:MAG: 23S rRNA (adenine(2503)-C(2))-methyltransferase RlmN [Spirochaetes bacterium]|nr:23S rRNA (adenine(2503)-C(2))-methyltransferase RlmN [Spirochaetota bacterium]